MHRNTAWINEILIDLIDFCALNDMSHLENGLRDVLMAHEKKFLASRPELNEDSETKVISLIPHLRRKNDEANLKSLSN